MKNSHLNTIKLLVVSALLLICGISVPAQDGTFKKPIIDSKVSKKEVFERLDPNCPQEIRKRQKIIKIKYYSFDGKIHRGQLVIDKSLVRDIKIIFKLALEEKFPIY